MLALLFAITGTATTLVVARLWLLQWVGSGQKFPVSQRNTVTIPAHAIESLVYYESDHGVGRHTMRLDVRDVYGERYQPHRPEDDNEFAIAGRYGRALFRLNLEEGGEYEIRCDNPNYESDDDIPTTDRVVFLKTPNTRAEVLSVRRAITTTGGTITIIGTILLYLLHGVALHRRLRLENRVVNSADPTYLSS